MQVSVDTNYTCRKGTVNQSLPDPSTEHFLTICCLKDQAVVTSPLKKNLLSSRKIYFSLHWSLKKLYASPCLKMLFMNTCSGWIQHLRHQKKSLPSFLLLLDQKLKPSNKRNAGSTSQMSIIHSKKERGICDFYSAFVHFTGCRVGMGRTVFFSFSLFVLIAYDSLLIEKKHRNGSWSNCHPQCPELVLQKDTICYNYKAL